jgi:hypothetical protein
MIGQFAVTFWSTPEIGWPDLALPVARPYDPGVHLDRSFAGLFLTALFAIMAK